MIQMKVNECTLSDGSKIYDVILTDSKQDKGEDKLKVNTLSEFNAIFLISRLQELLEIHTV